MSASSTMKIYGFSNYGGPNVATLQTAPSPISGRQPHSPTMNNTVVVRMLAAGVNPADIKVRNGDRQGKVAVNFPMAMGREAAGVVIASNVPGVRLGDTVFGSTATGTGAYADYVTLNGDSVCPIPAGVPIEFAATIPVSAGTAWDAFHQFGFKTDNGTTADTATTADTNTATDAAACTVDTGTATDAATAPTANAAARAANAAECLVVLGAGGGVGSMMVQMAAHFGVRVIGVSSAGKKELVESFTTEAATVTHVESGDGWVERVRAAVASEKPEEPEENKTGITAVFDTVGGLVLLDSAQLEGPRPGRRISIGVASDEQRELAGADRVTRRRTSEVFGQIAELMRAEAIAPVISATYPLDEAAAAVAAVETGHATGKTVITARDAAAPTQDAAKPEHQEG